MRKNPAAALSEFLERVASVSDSEQIDSSGGRAALMTLHTSKGLEYPIVFIAGMEEGLFPHSRSADIDEEVEEERRLCYVGMTRARQLLYLTNTLSREIYGVRTESRQSRFLREVDPALIRRIAPERQSSPIRPLSPREPYVDLSDSQLPDDEPGPGGDGLPIGARVIHPTFGRGHRPPARGARRRRQGMGEFRTQRDQIAGTEVREPEVDWGLNAPVSFHPMRRIPPAPEDYRQPARMFMKRFIDIAIRWFPALFLVALVAIPAANGAWTEDEFEKRPLYAYPLPRGKDDIIGNLITYQIQKGDTLLDVGRWFGVTAKEISNANGGLDWWAPPAGRTIILPDEHILPNTPRVGIVMNIPEMRIYYYYPSPTGPVHSKGKVTPAKFDPGKKHSAAVSHRRWCTHSRSASGGSIGRLRSEVSRCAARPATRPGWCRKTFTRNISSAMAKPSTLCPVTIPTIPWVTIASN